MQMIIIGVFLFCCSIRNVAAILNIFSSAHSGLPSSSAHHSSPSAVCRILTFCYSPTLSHSSFCFIFYSRVGLRHTGMSIYDSALAWKPDNEEEWKKIMLVVRRRYRPAWNGCTKSAPGRIDSKQILIG